MESGQVQLVEETVQLPAESKLIKDTIVDVVAKLKAGKPITEIAIGELAALEKAVAGYSALSAEVKAKEEKVLAGLMAGQILAALS